MLVSGTLSVEVVAVPVVSQPFNSMTSMQQQLLLLVSPTDPTDRNNRKGTGGERKTGGGWSCCSQVSEVCWLRLLLGLLVVVRVVKVLRVMTKLAAGAGAVAVEVQRFVQRILLSALLFPATDRPDSRDLHRYKTAASQPAEVTSSQ